MIKLEIPGNPITKKNSQRIIRTHSGRPFLLPSKQFKEYEETAKLFIKASDEPIKDPVNVKCLYFMKTRRKVDLTNLLEATDDILVNCGVLEDDNSQIVASHDGSRVFYDKDNPRVEITIEEVYEGDF